MFEKCQFITSATNITQSPNTNDLAEFVFLGRSNVGKSSLINAIAKRKVLARVSSRPGKTITINYFLIDDSFYLVDVPGYGYANRAKTQKEGFGKAIEDYLNRSQNIRCVFLLVDTKVGPTNDDLLMYNYLLHLGLNVVILSTKTDKIGTTLRYKALKAIKNKIQNDEIILTSSVTNLGINEIYNIMKKHL